MKTFSLVLCSIFSLATSPGLVAAQVTDLPSNELGGRYLEDATGLVWLDVSNFYGKQFSEVATELTGSGFRIARTSEVQRLLDALQGTNAALGIASDCDPSLVLENSACFVGFFHDGDANPRNGQAGERNVGSGSTDSVISNFYEPDEANSTLGAWAVQQSAASCSNSQELDFDCDGVDDKVVWREASGTWFVRLSESSDAILQQWGLPGDIPITGDYDGDGVPDLAVWRPANGTWYVKNSSSQYSSSSATIMQFGLPGDVPMRMDIDSDGRLDFVVWRPSEGNFYMNRSSDGQTLVEQFGLPGDIPVTAGRSGG